MEVSNLEFLSYSMTPERIEHIAKHNLTVDQVEEATFDDDSNLIQRLRNADRNPTQRVYRLLGCTHAGRYIAFFCINEGKGIVYPVTARDMNLAERKYYNARKG